MTKIRHQLSEVAKGRTAFVLIVVLVTIAILSLAGYAFSLLMVHEDHATRLAGRQIQSRYLVESGVEYTRLYLSNDEETIREMGGRWHAPEIFQGKLVSINPLKPTELGRFTVIASNLNVEGHPDGFRNGLTDESSKLNLNILTYADQWLPGGGRQLLMALPMMTEDVADAILDWLDEDSIPRDYGCEESYYAGLSPPYAPKNGPMDSLEELLLIRGVTPQLLFGMDANHNGVLDLDEQYSDEAAAYTPEMLLGWANYLTLFSKEANLNSSGLQRIFINSDNLEQLYVDLGSVFNEQWKSFIIAFRQKGPFTGEIPEDAPEPPAYLPVDLSEPATVTFQQILDLVDAKVKTSYVDEDGNDVEVYLESPINSLNLPNFIHLIMDNLTTLDSPSIPGRVNIMEAPRRVLEGIPGMTVEAIDTIITRREQELNDPTFVDHHRQYETWILVENIVDLPTMRVMLPFVCVSGDVYKAEIVGYFEDNSATSRAEVILDTTVPLPRILFWRDKSHLQSGYSVDTLGIGLQSQ